ncbi:hypothetical protein QQS21_011205 [Conoideocrella luteorostrata]|uniref:Uncharacterized protein n=1 Tax=Conoideocrella luteorostrata TaxID=1105319 RepID=A0AAJ0FNS5_9HYPO|nr:hypothetical protein QQS21_011205 [Conoideocrella luteorostrata]
MSPKHPILAHAFFILSLALPFSAAQIDSCQNACNSYNSILVSCNRDAAQQSVYNSCVCNSGNFGVYVDQCIACEGASSKPAKFKQTCKSVPPDCTTACQGFGIILQGCGSTSSAGFGNCVCSAAYDQRSPNTFNQDFVDCVTCENGGGNAAYWEAFCCKTTGNCNGMSAEASAAMVSISASKGGGASKTSPAPGPVSTSPNPTPGLAATPPVDRRLWSLAGLFLFVLLR